MKNAKVANTRGKNLGDSGKTVGIQTGPAHKHIADDVTQYVAGGHVHHQKEFKKHAAGHTPFPDHVKKMAKGGC